MGHNLNQQKQCKTLFVKKLRVNLIFKLCTNPVKSKIN